MLSHQQTIYFHDYDGPHTGIIEKINKKTVNVIEQTEKRSEGYQLWRIEESFLADSPELAKVKWKDYLARLKQFKLEMHKQRYGRGKFERGMSVLVYSLNGPPYKGIVLKLNKATLDIVTEDKRLMKVDKAICEHINDIIYFN